MNKEKKTKVIEDLKKIVGEEHVSDNAAVLSSYRYFIGKSYPPQIVTMPDDSEQVQQIVKLANQENLTILPIATGTKSRTRDADILLDLARMNKILRFDPENCFVLVEPGVTFNQLDPLLEEAGYAIARGTFPSSFSVAGNLAVCRSFNNNFSGRIGDQSLGVETVLMDGTMLRTGLATYGIEFWSTLNMDIPDYRGLFNRYTETNPLLGIITKAAIRIWPRHETQALPMGGFPTFEGAMRYAQAVSKAQLSDQTMVWSWVVMALTESKARESKEDLEFMQYRQGHDYTEPYKDMHYCYTWSQIRGYKEQVEAGVKVCERLAQENGGKILSDEELDATIPNVTAALRHHYRDFNYAGEKEGAPMLLWMHGGEGLGETCYYYGWVSDLIELEKAYNDRWTKDLKRAPVPYYVRIMEGGVGGHLRYIPLVDLMDSQEAQRTMARSAELHAWVHEKFPNVHCPMGNRDPDKDSIGMGHTMERLREALDPNHVGFRPGEDRLEPDEDEAVND